MKKELVIKIIVTILLIAGLSIGAGFLLREYVSFTDGTMYVQVVDKNGNMVTANYFNEVARDFTPKWHTDEYLTQMKRRLYTKNNNYYFQWKELGESDINMYYVDGMWRYYQNGKQIKTSINNFLIKNI